METEFKIKFDGETNQIDAKLLVNSLIHTSTIIQEINRNLDSGKKIDIQIKALEKGSFLIHIDLLETVADNLKNLLTKENIQAGAAILEIFVSLISLKMLLKGEESPAKVEETGNGNNVKISNKKGDVIYIDRSVHNIYKDNVIIRDSLAQNFETLENDPSVTGYEITDKNEKPLVRVNREDFEGMALKYEETTKEKQTTVTAARLNIIRISFDDKLQSDFYFKGNKISVKKINDTNFYKRIEKGESFAKGDVLEVELEIKRVFDPAVNTYVNKSYKINKIIKHIDRDEQSKMDFDFD